MNSFRQQYKGFSSVFMIIFSITGVHLFSAMTSSKYFQMKIVFLIILIFSAGCAKKTGEEKECETALVNKIKSMAEYKTHVYPDTAEKEYLSYVAMYDKNGLKTEERTYNPDSTVEGITIHYYNAEGNQILTTKRNPDSSLVYKIERTYLKNHLRKDYIFYQPDGSFKYKNSAVYDNEGKMIELQWIRPEGFVSKNKYVYEGKNMVEDSEYGSNEQLQYKWICKYDEAGNLVEKIQYYPDNSVNGKITYEYSDDNLLLKETNYSRESVVYLLEYSYDEKKLLKEKTASSFSGSILSRCQYRYEFY